MNYIKGMWFMKRKSADLPVKVIRGNTVEEMQLPLKFKYPFDEESLRLLKEENTFEQEYFYIESGDDYAFFVLYKNRMNLFTFGKRKCFYPLQVIGYPCSLSNCGYVTNNPVFMFDFIKNIKGAKLVLNVEENLQIEGMTVGETLPTCILENRFETMQEYMDSLRSRYRRRIRLAEKNCRDIEVRELSDSSVDIYPLYLNTYEKSDYKLEKLERGFFEKAEAVKLIFMQGELPRGFVMLKTEGEKLIFMLCGMDYEYPTTDLYYYMLFHIIQYAIEKKVRFIDLGQTSEETKMKFGAVLEKRFFYAHHTNPLLNGAVKLGKSLLEYHYEFPNYRVFREEIQ